MGRCASPPPEELVRGDGELFALGGWTVFGAACASKLVAKNAVKVRQKIADLILSSYAALVSASITVSGRRRMEGPAGDADRLLAFDAYFSPLRPHPSRMGGPFPAQYPDGDPMIETNDDEAETRVQAEIQTRLRRDGPRKTPRHRQQRRQVRA